MTPAAPTRSQIRATNGVVEWYLERHYGTDDDSGMPSTFCNPARVGSFALDQAAFARGDGATLFRLLIATTMFQRRQDQQVLRILRGMAPLDAAEVTDARRLKVLVDESPCTHLKRTSTLHEECDLQKEAGRGFCTRSPTLSCHLKHHTVVLKRYGHFGKVPTSVALMLSEAGVLDLPSLRSSILKTERTKLGRAMALEAVLSRAWRIDRKIASMFLSAVTNPDLPPGTAPWTEGVDWTYYVVVDSNVDLFLASIGYPGNGTYDARRAFVQALARHVDLRGFNRRLHAYNPRLVQQALYLFMSAANRRAAGKDCMHLRPAACHYCPQALSDRCSVRQRAT